MNDTAKQIPWAIGDLYWVAEGALHGREEDMGDCGQPCRTKNEATENARAWVMWLSPREQKAATVWVRQYRVLALDTESLDDDNIGSGESVGHGEPVCFDD